MSAVVESRPIRMTGSAVVTSRMPVDLTIPSAFYTLPSFSRANDESLTSSAASGLLHSPLSRYPMASNVSNYSCQVNFCNRHQVFAHNRDFLRFPSPSSTSSSTPTPLPAQRHVPLSKADIELSSSFPPTTFPYRHLHQIDSTIFKTKAIVSQPTQILAPKLDRDSTPSPETKFEAKIPSDVGSEFHPLSVKEHLERIPPAKSFILTLSPNSSDDNETRSKNESPCLEPTEARRDPIIDYDATGSKTPESSRTGDSHFLPRKPQISTPPKKSCIPSLSSSLPSSPHDTIHSTLFPVSFITPTNQSKANAEPSVMSMKRRHSSHTPIIVDSRIPFTTYLHNLTLTLQQSAAKAKLEWTNAQATSGEMQGMVCHAETDIKSNTDVHSSNVIHTRSPANQEEPALKRLKVIEDIQADCITRDNETRLESNKELVERPDDVMSIKVHERKRRQLLLSETRASDLYETTNVNMGFKSLDEKIKTGHSLSASILNSPAFNFSPNSTTLSPTHLQGPHVYQHQQHPQSLLPPQSLAPLNLRIGRSLREQHPQLSPVGQFPSLYSKLFQPFTTTSSPGHLGLSSSINASVQALEISPNQNRLNPLFHPAFLNLGNLGMRRASTDKPPPVKKYKCDVCQKAFSRSNTLVTHKRIHTGDKPFKCEICGRAFRQPGNLTRHRLTHTTHKPYVCHVCNKAFNRASNLNTHIRTHSSFRQFGCTSCPKNYPLKSELVNHIYAQNGERPFKCDICGRGFAHNGTLITHRRTHSVSDNPFKPEPEGVTSQNFP